MSEAAWEGLSLVCPRCRQALSVARGAPSCARCAVDYPVEDGVAHLAVGREGAPNYDPHFFHTLQHVEDRHFWFVARRQIVSDALRRAVPDLDERRLFDIGCGSGGLIQFLAREGVDLAGACDAYPQSLALVRERVPAPLVLVDEGRLPPLGPGHSLLSLFDVLEHLDDDREMLRFLHSVLAPGGVLLVTVPAHPFLFNERDELAHHRRRYRRGELKEKLEETGFRVRLLTHFGATLVPPLFVLQGLTGLVSERRRLSRERQVMEFRVVPVVNGLLRIALGLERLWLHVGTLPFGSSLIAVAERQGEP